MTTCCVHLDLLESLSADAFLMSLWRFIAWRGHPLELLFDNGTNFSDGARELCQAFETMAPHPQKQLPEQQIEFCFNCSILLFTKLFICLSRPCVSTGIGDGGNELGMGKLKEKVMNLMPKGRLIACDVPADYAITAGMDLHSIVNTVDYRHRTHMHKKN